MFTPKEILGTGHAELLLNQSVDYDYLHPDIAETGFNQNSQYRAYTLSEIIEFVKSQIAGSGKLSKEAKDASKGTEKPRTSGKSFSQVFQRFTGLRRFSVYNLERNDVAVNVNQLLLCFLRAMLANDDFRHLFFGDAQTDLRQLCSLL